MNESDLLVATAFLLETWMIKKSLLLCPVSSYLISIRLFEFRSKKVLPMITPINKIIGNINKVKIISVTLVNMYIRASNDLDAAGTWLNEGMS